MSHYTDDTAVIIPWRPSPDRYPLLGYAARWWEACANLVPVLGVGGEYRDSMPEPWRKGVNIAAGVTVALARNPGLRAFVIADADVFMGSDPARGFGDLFEAIEHVRSGRYAWAVPHRDVWRHPEEWTARTLQGFSVNALPDEGVVIHRGHPGGGLLVVSRQIADERLFPDPRFAGWGQEDDSWAFALATLHGAPWRGTAPLHHLWHKPQERMTRETGSVAGAGLYREYLRARHNKPLMRGLVDDGWHWWDDRERQRRGAP